MRDEAGLYEFWIDRGGTFTDVIARDATGRLTALKLLSVNPESYADAAVEGMRRVLRVAPGAPIPKTRIKVVKMGTTVATNALLERKGEPTLLVTSQGLKDQLRIGYQARPRLFDRAIRLPKMLYADAIEADERIAADGAVLTPLDEAALARDLKAARARGLSACAIVFMHAFRFPAHERRAGQIARDAGFTQVTLSHDVSPLIKFVSRGDTAVVDAYLSPVLRRYVETVARELDGVPLYFMQSNGGLTGSENFRGRDAILSGPAGGVVGMAETARAAGFPRVIGFDMGGTSTDVSLYAGAFERVSETEIAGVRVKTPMLSVDTVASGGGSIIVAEPGRIRVGPESAGADPGPLAYRRGGPLTVTDANVAVGKILPAHFPKIFGPKADQPLDAEGVRAAFAALEAKLGKSALDIADGAIRIAVENMAAAIRRISIARGRDATAYALNCFGGAGGQHACKVADALGIETVLVHPLSSLLSAYGIGVAPVRALRARMVSVPLAAKTLFAVEEATHDLAATAREDVERQGVAGIAIAVTRRAYLRYEGSDTALPLLIEAEPAMRTAFEREHARVFGFAFEGRAIIAESVEVEAASATTAPPPATSEPTNASAPEPHERTRFYADGAWHEAGVYLREKMATGARVAGPAIVIEPHQTIVVEPGWSLTITAANDVVMTRIAKRERPRERTARDPVLVEVFNNLFMAIAEDMGTTLQMTAASVNIKERLDFSCAVFDAEGNLIANAPHMPVHLGSMGDSVAAVRAKHGDGIAPGDVFATNAPYNGGTHLPDITIVMPVFDAAGALAYWTAARGHHADIGGISPGSMPPFSKTVDEEGTLLDAIPVVKGGAFLEAETRAAFTRGPYPSRNPDQNVADLKAQIASCKRGATELARAAAEHGADVIAAYMRHVQDNAEEAVRAVIGKLSDGAFEAPMDSGAVIKVAMRVDRDARTATIDFTGTSPQRADNFNAPASVTKAAVLYVFRCLVESDIPMNAGCLRPLKIVAPLGSMLNPRPPAAVVAGNVETSQAVVDALFGALGTMAAAQGTMNNLTFGDAKHQYYETICGGAGAGPGFDGASAVHTHMTNSRLTDPEILETRFPVVLRRFAIREGSGGTGAHKGGDGVVREIEFRAAMETAILSTRRMIAPFGLAGGDAARPGRNTVLRADGRSEDLGGCGQTKVAPGDRVRIETPGGGGFGRP